MNRIPNVPGDDRPLPGELQELFSSYRNSFQEMDASANFMPVLWGKIDARRRVSSSFGRLAAGFVTVAFLICLVLTGSLVMSTQSPKADINASYVDVLAEDTADTDVSFELVAASTGRL